MDKILLVGVGGFFGAIARYLMAGAVRSVAGGHFPLGTLLVNALGCLGLGAFLAWVERVEDVPQNLRYLIVIGLLGAFTTFSTFGFDTVELWREGRSWQAALNVGGNLILGLAALVLGRYLVLGLR